MCIYIYICIHTYICIYIYIYIIERERETDGSQRGALWRVSRSFGTPDQYRGTYSTADCPKNSAVNGT